jgi:hypothetical protein
MDLSTHDRFPSRPHHHFAAEKLNALVAAIGIAVEKIRDRLLIEIFLPGEQNGARTMRNEIYLLIRGRL